MVHGRLDINDESCQDDAQVGKNDERDVKDAKNDINHQLDLFRDKHWQWKCGQQLYDYIYNSTLRMGHSRNFDSSFADCHGLVNCSAKEK